jgi:hypothetical protein
VSGINTKEAAIVSTKTLTKQKPEKISIFIDGAKYHAAAAELTGAQIRELAQPPVAEDRDLWLDIVDKLDELIEDDQVVHLEAKMRFFSVPREINPGQQAADDDREQARR